MFKEIMAWLQIENNREILKMAGGALATVVGAIWAFLMYLEQRKRNRVAREPTENTPAHQRQHNRRSVPIRTSPNALSVLRIELRWLLVAAIVALGIGYFLYGFFNSATAIRVCRGQYEDKCAAHEVFIQCQEIPDWANATCKSWTSTLINGQDGNRCGYTTMEIMCLKKN